MRLTRWLPLPALLTLLAACGQPQVEGGLLLRWKEADGRTVEAQGKATLALGPVWGGERVVRQLEVVNAGSAPVLLSPVRAVEGTVGGEGAFHAEWQGNLQLAPGTAATLHVRFAPPAEGAPTPAERPHRAVLALAAEGSPRTTATLTLEARALVPGCPYLEGHDFGPALLGDAPVHRLTLHNPAPLPWAVQLGAPRPLEGAPDAFALVGMEPGTVTVPAGGTLEVPLRYAPPREGWHRAALSLGAGASCPARDMALLGQGLTRALLLEPAGVDCGAVPLGREVQRTLRVRNSLQREVSLTAVQSTAARVGLVEALPVVLPPSGEAALTVRCAPAQEGLQDAELLLVTSEGRDPEYAVRVRLYGGGPKLSLQPEAVSFGEVAWLEGHAQPGVERTVLVENAGNSLPLTLSHLQVGTPGPGDTWNKPLAVVVAVGEATGAEEFSLVEDWPFLLAPGDTRTFDVRLTPTSPGPKQAELVLLSNDLRRPEVRLPLSAEVVSLPPCRYRVDTSAPTFGQLGAGERRTLDVVLTNLGTQPGEVCLLDRVTLTQETGSPFSVSGLPALPARVEAGAQLGFQVQVEAPADQASLALGGTLRLRLSSAEAPLAELPLSAQVGPGCVQLVPDRYDFGVLTPGCGRSTTTFHLMSRCEGVTLRSIQAVGACALGSGSCSTFHVDTVPAVGSVVPMSPSSQPAAPLTFTVSVGTQQEGLQVAAVRVETSEGAHILPLRAQGRADGLVEDVLFPGGPLKADVLVVASDTHGETWRVGQRFAELTQWAQAHGVDWRLAVIGEAMEPENRPGGFWSGPGHPDPVLTPTSPQVAAQYEARMNALVNTPLTADEQPLLATLTALTAPLTATTNSGFLREDAVLGVLYVLDSGDHSGLEPHVLLQALRTIKGAQRPGWLTLSLDGYLFGASMERVDEVVTATGGAFINQTQGPGQLPPTSADYAAFFARAFGQRERYLLAQRPQTPVDGHLEVWVDGTPVPGGEGWTYDAATKSVRFAAGHAPAPGQQVRARYRQACP